jgi:hypothetical protein
MHQLSKTPRRQPIDPRTATEAECWQHLPYWTTCTKQHVSGYYACTDDGREAKGKTALGALRNLLAIVQEPHK